MVSVLPRASPRAAAFGRKSNFMIAASTACLRPLLTFTVPLMIRDTVLAETPASRATILRVPDRRGRGPLLPGVATEVDFDFISLPAVFDGAGSLRKNPLQFLERLSLGLRRQQHDEKQAGGGKQPVAEKGACRTPDGQLRGEEQGDAGADQRVPKSDHRNCRGPLLVRKDLGEHHPHH